jgi:hypothetical protein
MIGELFLAVEDIGLNSRDILWTFFAARPVEEGSHRKKECHTWKTN